MRSMRPLALTLGLVALPALALALPYSVTIENMVAGGPDTGQPLTPAVVIVHDAGYSLFTLGAAATAGLEALAEDGMTAGLVGEANASPNVDTVEIGGGGPFFGSVTVMFEANPGDLISIASMFARTNDVFTGLNGVALPAAGVMVLPTNAYDAGTEVNTGLIAHIPFYGNPGVGDDENGTVSMIGMYQVVDDPVHGTLSWTFPPAAVVTIVAENPAPVEDSSWASVKSL